MRRPDLVRTPARAARARRLLDRRLPHPHTKTAPPDRVPARATPCRPNGALLVQFRDVLARRRMHRAFLPDPVPPESLERIARTIRRAPSGGFSQGQSLVVVTEADTR